MKANKFISLALIGGAVAIVWMVAKNMKEKKEVEGLKDQQLAGTNPANTTLPGKADSSLVATDNPVPGAQYFVNQPNMLNYVQEMSQDAMNYM